MAEVVLKDIKKVYTRDEKAERKKKKGENTAKKTNLQITDEGVVAVQQFNLHIKDKEFVVLVGPSGCGKSTTLRMVAGLEEITEGELYIDGRLMNKVEAKDRDIAMVFQNYALYPHMTVYDNMAYSLKVKKYKKDEIDRIVRESARILDIEELLNRKPGALSGGQKQRVAIGRAFVRNPKVFLMDEPLSNLDAKLRNQMRAEIMKLRNKIDTTFIYVTHDQTEAMTLGDRIVVMKDGFIQQIGTPQEVFAEPANLFVAGFIGVPQMNFFMDCALVKTEAGYVLNMLDKEIALTEKQNEALSRCGAGSRDVIAGVRPADIKITVLPEEQRADADAFIDLAEMMGSEMHLHLSLAHGRSMDEEAGVIAIIDTPEDRADDMSRERPLHIEFNPAKIHLFDSETEENLVHNTSTQ